MGKLWLPMPQLGKGEHSLEVVAKHMQDKIRAQAPKDLGDTITVKPFTKGKSTGLAINYDDRAERYVYVAIEYPAGSCKEESATPRKPTC